MNSDLKATAEFLKTCTRVSIFSHVNPDGDAIGSSCALAKGLASLGVKADIYNVSPIPKAYYFLPKAKEIKLFSGTEELAPVIIVADCANLKRAELDKYPESLAGKIVVEIDHHVGNEYFGKYNYVESESIANWRKRLPHTERDGCGNRCRNGDGFIFRLIYRQRLVSL